MIWFTYFSVLWACFICWENLRTIYLFSSSIKLQNIQCVGFYWRTCDFPVWERVKHIVPVSYSTSYLPFYCKWIILCHYCRYALFEFALFKQRYMQNKQQWIHVHLFRRIQRGHMWRFVYIIWWIFEST
jgi:hypothetical protein